MNIGAIALSGWLMLGWLPQGGLVVYDPPTCIDINGSFLMELGAEASWGPLFAGGSLQVPVWKTGDGPYFWPTQLISTTDIGFEFGPARLGWKHCCAHPVTPYLVCWYDGQLVPKFDSFYDLVYLRLSIGDKK